MNEYNKPMILFPEIILITADLFDAQSEGKCTVFLDISGHVQSFKVRVFKNSWVRDTDPDFDETVYMDGDNSTGKFMELRHKVKKFLSSIDETTFERNYQTQTV